MLPIADLLTSGRDALTRPDASVRTHALGDGEQRGRGDAMPLLFGSNATLDRSGMFLCRVCLDCILRELKG